MARTYIWELRNPDGGPTGLEFAKGRSAPTDVMIGHSFPERVNIVVRDEEDNLIARGKNLSHPEVSPMCRLVLKDGSIERENIWPTDENLEEPVILPGGEVGILKAWWNADDHNEWRWTVEFSNRRPRSRR
jgi:hypothetical protein